MKIIDTHQHLWDLAQFSYGWTANVPALNRNFLFDDYNQASAGFDIIKTVHLECDVDEAFMVQETKHILQLADQTDNPLSGVVACCRPESPDFPAYLEQILGHPKLKGVRRILHVVPDEISLSPSFIPNLNLLPQHQLSFDLCILARQFQLAIRLLESCPEVQFILDHCANAPIESGDLSEWRAGITRVAAFPNIVCKVSGIVTNAPDDWVPADLQPVVEHVIESFGWDRVMFGSDWPVCTLKSTYQRWLNALLELTASAGEAQQTKLFRTNAERIYRI